LVNNKDINVCSQKIPPASTLPINNEIDNDDSLVTKTSALTNMPISEGIKQILV